MKRKKRKPFNAQKSKRNAILIGVISLLVLIGTIVAAVMISKNKEDEKPSEDPAEQSEISAESEIPEESEPEEEKDPEPIVLTSDMIPDPVNLRSLSIDDSELAEKFKKIQGEYPVIADVSCSADGQCVAMIVHFADFGEKPWVQYEFRFVDIESGTFGKAVPDGWELFSYDRNSDNHNGKFVIEYDNPSEKRGPYVLYYQVGDEKNVLTYGEEQGEYARLIRQNDFYAVYSLNHDDESEYFVIDKAGEIVYELGWDADIAFQAPLMFYHDLLLCKSDTDDDYVYDTVSVIDLKDGSSRELVSVGNCERWTYSSDGSVIAFYGKEKGEDTLLAVYTEDLLNGKTQVFSYKMKNPIKKVDVIGSSICLATDGEQKEVGYFSHDVKKGFRTMIVPLLSEDATVSFGYDWAAILDNCTLTICK